jgi:hypothetical protein
MMSKAFLAVLTAAAVGGLSEAARIPVLHQIDLPHNYYFRELYLPQLTSGPSSVTWMPDGTTVVYSMEGSLWRQRVDETVAEQLTDDRGTDYQPDCSPDGRSVAFVRYDGRSMELMLLDVETRGVHPLTSGGAVNVEPRWSPDGSRLAFVSTANTGHFLLHVADIREDRVAASRPLLPDRRSAVARYYYSPFDHAINPAWTRDGKELIFVSNREIAHGTGDLVRMRADGTGAAQIVQHEETSWHARPDISPDGTRIVYSSYLGRQWQQLWMVPASGGYPFPLTYGDYDNTNPRWSPDGRRVAFISNRSGNTSLWLMDAFSGEQGQLQITRRRYKATRAELQLRVRDENGAPLPARVSVTDHRLHAYAPSEAWIHADDSVLPDGPVETRYFHTRGDATMVVPSEPLAITVGHGPAYEIVTLNVDPRSTDWTNTQTVTLRRLRAPIDSGEWWSGDLHVHMNYGGLYRNTPAHLVEQGSAEDLNLVYDLVVNKEQRFPDIASFRTDVDPASTDRTLVLHGQEFHTSYWGHLAILNLTEHLLLPGYAGYPFTAAESRYPHNSVVADMAHRQQGLVGYAHPFEEDIDPKSASTLTNELPVDAALGKVDYYEAIGFADHKASNAIWYRLLDCGLRIPAAAGTDAMANYASLRGPVGLNRTYVPAAGRLTRDAFFAQLRKGHTVATNGALINLKVGDAGPGDTVSVPAGTRSLPYRATLRANFPVDHLELVSNGEVVARLDTGADRRAADVRGAIDVDDIHRGGWMLLRAWNDNPRPEVLDIYPYATTSPVYVQVDGRVRRSADAATYFLRWLDRIQAAVEGDASYRTNGERAAVLQDVARARDFYERCRQEATVQ